MSSINDKFLFHLVNLIDNTTNSLVFVVPQNLNPIENNCQASGVLPVLTVDVDVWMFYRYVVINKYRIQASCTKNGKFANWWTIL